MDARAWPSGCLCPGPERFGLRNSLRSDSPRLHIEFGTGAQPRPQALPPLSVQAGHGLQNKPDTWFTSPAGFQVDATAGPG